MKHLTNDGNFIHYAVEVKHNDGPYVLCVTQSLEVAQLVSQSQTMDDEHGLYYVRRLIPYDSINDDFIWLGFPFPSEKTLPSAELNDEQLRILSEFIE